MNFRGRNTRLPDKNPLHASALTLRDMKRGLRVILCHAERGELFAMTIISLPLMRNSPTPNKQNGKQIRARYHGDGSVGLYDLAALGVIPYPIVGWSKVSFLIDFNKRHILNRRHLRLPAPSDSQYSHE